MPRSLLFAAALVAGLAGPVAGAAVPSADPRYADADTRRLHEAAMAAQMRRDDSIVEYTAVIRQRVGARLRMPLKDRTVYRSESAQRVLWRRDGVTLVQLLAFREQTPLGVTEGAAGQGMSERAFDPLGDRLLFGFAEPKDFRE